MSVNPTGAIGYEAKTDRKGRVTVTYQGKTTIYKNYNEFVELFKKQYDAQHPQVTDPKGTTVQKNPDAQELTPEQKAKRDQARQAELDEVAAAKKQVQEKGLETEHGVITSYTGTFKDERTGEEKKVNVFTFDIKAPEAEQQKIKKENEQVRMARYYDEDAGEWIELGEKYQTMKDVRAALKTKKETIDDELDALKKKIKASKKDSNVPLKQIKEDNARLAYLQQEYAQVKQAYKASKGRGIKGDTKAYNANVKANNRLVNREVYYDKAAAKAAEKDPANEGKTIKFATDDDKAVLRALSATAMQHFEESSSPQEKAMWNELAHLFTDEKGNEIPIEKVDTKKIQDALIDLTGGDMRLNYKEQQMVATETGLSMSDVRHAFRTYGFEAPHPIGKRLVNGLLAAAPVAASMGLGYLLSKNKSHAEAHSEQTNVDHAVSDASQTTIVNGKVTATAHAEVEIPGQKIDWIASNGEEYHKRIAGQFAEDTQSVTEYYEAIAKADAHAEAYAKAFASADAACTAVAALKPAALAAAPLVAFLAGFAKRPAEISAVKGAATTQKMATYVDVFRKNKNKNIGNQIIQMAGQITGDKAIDRALIVSVLDHDIGSQNTTPTTRELRNALAHLDAIKKEVDKFKKLPPKPQPEPSKPQPEPPKPQPTECPVDLDSTPVQYIHKRKAGDTWSGLVQAYYPDCLKGENKHSMSECIRELKTQLAYDDEGNFHKDIYQSLLKGHDIPKELKMPEKIFDCEINKDAKVKPQEIVHGNIRGKVLDKAGRKYNHATMQSCKDNEPTNAPEGTVVKTGGKTFKVVNGKWAEQK